MAQGTVKPNKIGRPSNSKPQSSSGVTKKGSLKFNPKKSKLIKQAKINKKFTSGLTAQTERMLGERAGHLEMLGGGRKKTQGGVDKKGGKVKTGKKD